MDASQHLIFKAKKEINVPRKLLLIVSTLLSTFISKMTGIIAREGLKLFLCLGQPSLKEISASKKNKANLTITWQVVLREYISEILVGHE